MDLIETHSMLLQNNLDEHMCVFDSSILETQSEQWKFNRNLNSDKIQAIMNTIKGKSVLDTVLHFFYNNDENRLVCFDGNHRREALILLYRKYNLNIKVCCYIYKCKNSNNIDKEIVEKFRIINQNTPIPDIYMDIIDNLNENEALMEKKRVIEKIYTKYKNLYTAFYSVNSKCRRPNFNETSFKDLCNSFEFTTESKLDSLLKEFNLTKKNQKHNSKLSSSQLTKCETYDFFIFT